MKAGAAHISWPRRFDSYTEEFLVQHPGYSVRTRAPLALAVPTRRGAMDDAVAVSAVEMRLHTASQACDVAHGDLRGALQAAQEARSRWHARRMRAPGVLKTALWQAAHAALQRVARWLPQEASPSLRRQNTWSLLKRHLGTTYAAERCARRYARACVRLAALEHELCALHANVEDLRQAVRRDLAEAAIKTPANLQDFPKYRDRLLSTLTTKRSVSLALGDPTVPAALRRQHTLTELPRHAVPALDALLLSALDP